MDIEESILRYRSNENIWEIAHFVLNNPEEMETIWGLIENGSEQMQMRASWVLGKVIEKNATLLGLSMERLLDKLGSSKNDGLKRNLLRSVYFSEIKNQYYSILFDLACRFVLNPSEPIAVRMFSMRIANRIVVQVPELSQELLQVLESISGTVNTPGLRNAYLNVLKEVRRI